MKNIWRQITRVHRYSHGEISSFHTQMTSSLTHLNKTSFFQGTDDLLDFSKGSLGISVDGYIYPKVKNFNNMLRHDKTGVLICRNRTHERQPIFNRTLHMESGSFQQHYFRFFRDIAHGSYI